MDDWNISPALKTFAAHLETECVYGCCGLDAYDPDIQRMVSYLDSVGLDVGQTLVVELEALEHELVSSASYGADEMSIWRRRLSAALGWVAGGRAASKLSLGEWARRCEEAS